MLHDGEGESDRGSKARGKLIAPLIARKRSCILDYGHNYKNTSWIVTLARAAWTSSH